MIGGFQARGWTRSRGASIRAGGWWGQRVDPAGMWTVRSTLAMARV